MAATLRPAPDVLAYDAGCGPCRRFKGLISFLDARRRIAYVSLQDAEELGLLVRVPESLRYASAHFIEPDGRVTSGPLILIRLLGDLPGGRLTSTVLRRCGPVARMMTLLYSAGSRLHRSSACGVSQND